MPAQLFVKQALEKDASKRFYVRISNFPDLYREQNILRLLTKKIPQFTHSKLLMEQAGKIERKRGKTFSGSVLIEASDR